MLTSATLMGLLGLSYTCVCFVNAQPQCFWPDGTSSPDYPCKPAASASACCGLGWNCLSNGLCYSANIALTRSSCTDKTWSTSECPTYCAFSTTREGNLDLCPLGSTIGYGGSELRSFCCHDDLNCNCSTGENVILLNPTPPTITSLTPLSTSTKSSTNISDSTATTALSTAAVAPLSNHYIAIILGLGLPLGLAILGVIAFLLSRTRRFGKTTVVQPNVNTEIQQPVISDMRLSHTRQPSVAEMQQPSMAEVQQPSDSVWCELDHTLGVGEALPALRELGQSPMMKWERYGLRDSREET